MRKKNVLIIYSLHVIQDVYVFLSSVEKKLRFLMKTFQDLCSFKGLQIIPDDECGSYLAKRSVIKIILNDLLYKHTNARLFCDACPRLHVIRNDVEKVTLVITHIHILFIFLNGRSFR